MWAKASNFRYFSTLHWNLLRSVYRKPINKNVLLHFFSFHDMNKKVLPGSCLRTSRVSRPINNNSEIKFLHAILINLGYLKHLIEQVFSATNFFFITLLLCSILVVSAKEFENSTSKCHRLTSWTRLSTSAIRVQFTTIKISNKHIPMIT